MLENARFSQAQLSGEDDYARPVATIGFASVLGTLRRSAGLILTLLGIAVLVAFVYLQITPAMYRTSARVILLDAPSVAPFQQESVFSSATYNVSEVESQTALIKSDYIIRKLIETYNLTEDPRIMEPRRGLRRLTLDLLEPVLGQYGIFKPLLNWLGPEKSKIEPFEMARERIYAGLSVNRIGLTYVLDVEVTWDSPETAAFIANALAQVYLADRLQRRQNEAELATNWFNERLTELREKATTAGEVIEDYRTDNLIIDPGREGLIIEQQVGQFRQTVEDASIATEAAQAKLTKVRDIIASDLLNAPLAGISDSPVISQLRSDLVALGLQEAEAIRTYGSDHQVTRNLRSRMSDIEQKLLEELKQLEVIYQRDYNVAQVNEKTQRDKLDAAMADAAKMGAAQFRLRALESEAGVYRNLYDSYLQRYLQTQQQRSFPSAEARIISDAQPPEDKLGPSTSLTLGLALSVAGFIGLAVAFARDLSDRSVRTSAQVRQVAGVRTLGIIPTRGHRLARQSRGGSSADDLLDVERPLDTSDPFMSVVVDDPSSSTAETIRRLKVAVDAMPRGKVASFVGFISSDAQEGRSIVAANYAQLLAKVGRRTLLVDGDTRTLTLTHRLAPAAKVGLIELSKARHETEMGAATWVDPRTGLHFMPGRGLDIADKSHPGVLEADRLMLSLTLMAKNYDSVIIDLPALIEYSDAAALEKFVDGFVLVVEWGKTSADSLGRALAAPHIDPDKIVGAVLDNVDPRKFATYEKLK